ncbi:hypothetical protein GUJ93_ZPchr0002g26075 [Zizania palustris]|uniref:Uncharacterized protein n=1 Tax=Zizania palustris TaxID=103762 RepID=A0A8J5RXN8_ZIZPA|nr:hypothetical protein GUJ93_ZPchr0002g26075 [Zizania palustris]
MLYNRRPIFWTTLTIDEPNLMNLTFGVSGIMKCYAAFCASCLCMNVFIECMMNGLLDWMLNVLSGIYIYVCDFNYYAVKQSVVICAFGTH